MLKTKQPNPTDQHVGSRVRMRRLALGLTQEKLGEALGVTFQQVQKYEKGTNRIGASRLQQIGAVLKVPVSFFFEGVSGQGPAPMSDFTQQFLATRDGVELARIWPRVPKGIRRKLVALAGELVGDEAAASLSNAA